MQEIKLIVSDIDGTLVHALTKDAPWSNHEAIKRAQKEGIPFTLATGRAIPTTRQFMHMFNVELPVITCNGAEITNDGEIYYSERFSPRLVQDITDALNGIDAHYFIFSLGKVCCMKSDLNERLHTAWKVGGMRRSDLVYAKSRQHLLDLTVNDTQKILAWAKTEEEHREVMKLRGRFAAADALNTLGLNAEFLQKGIHKGYALKQLCEMYDISSQNVLALGDEQNDIEMLQFAGVGVTMSNAPDNVKAAADHTIDNEAGDGVAKAINKFVFKE
jgi:Cof subfamily protein (haloacid dehalogenase superfamily)